MHEKMRCIFKAAPQIIFRGEAYHTETHYETYYDKGRRKSRMKTRKVVTHKASANFTYYSFRDVSGSFVIACDETKIDSKYYIMLELEEEFNFADAISYSDYERMKAKFIAQNNTDKHFDFSEERKIPGLEHYNLVNLKAAEPFFVGVFWFVLLDFLCLAEFYKLYVRSKCVYQKFKVRKIISTRYDLNKPEIVKENKYDLLQPKLNLIKEEYTFADKDCYSVNEENALDLPSLEEIEAAEASYREKIPVYQVAPLPGNLSNSVVIQTNQNVNYECNSNYDSQNYQQINNGDYDGFSQPVSQNESQPFYMSNKPT